MQCGHPILSFLRLHSMVRRLPFQTETIEIRRRENNRNVLVVVLLVVIVYSFTIHEAMLR